MSVSHRGVSVSGRADASLTSSAQPSTETVRATFGLDLRQVVRLLTGALWMYWAQAWINVSGVVPLGAALAAISAAGSLCIMGAAIMVRGREAEARVDRFILVACLGQVALQIVVQSSGHGYGSDELAFNQTAASLLLHGTNPYGASFAYSLRQFGVGWGTLTLSGQMVSSMSYPALSVLFYVPASLLLGAGTDGGLVTDALFWVIGGVLLWRMAGPALRPYVPLLLMLPIPLIFVAGGATDPLYLPFVLIAVWRWDRFGDPDESSPARWIGPIALGIACCVKQTPWLLVPFLVTGVAIESQLRGRSWFAAGTRYALLCGAAFLVPNLAFIAWNPGAWLTAVLLPLRSALVPLGIGPAELVSAYGLGGGDLGLFGFAGALLTLATLVIFVRKYERLKLLFPLLPLCGVLFESRSLESYFIFLIPILLVTATSVTATPWKAWGRRTALGLTAGGGALAAVSVVLLLGALIDRPPLTMTVQHGHVSSSLLVTDMTVANTGTEPVDVHFLLALDGTAEQLMRVTAGPAVLSAGAHASYTVEATGQTPLPSAGYPFQIELTSTDPDILLATPQLTVGVGGGIAG